MLNYPIHNSDATTDNTINTTSSIHIMGWQIPIISLKRIRQRLNSKSANVVHICRREGEPDGVNYIIVEFGSNLNDQRILVVTGNRDKILGLT